MHTLLIRGLWYLHDHDELEQLFGYISLGNPLVHKVLSMFQLPTTLRVLWTCWSLGHSCFDKVILTYSNIACTQ